MLLYFGRVPVLVASSADAACEIMKNHDLSFSDRPLYKAHKKILYNGRDVVFAPYGEYWRQAKGNFVLKLLSSRRVQSFQQIREEETARFVKKIRESSSGYVNLSGMFFQFAIDAVCMSAFGRRYSESEMGRKFLSLLVQMTEVLGAISIGEFIPWLSWIDRVTGFGEKTERVARGLDEVLENVISDRLQNQDESTQEKIGEDFLDILLEIYNEETNSDVSGNRESIKAIILDVFGAGTDTSAVVLEWTMTELLRHPQVMKKLQSEVREIMDQKGDDITGEDIEKMHYLKAVIKESFRCHPPFPLLLPRVARRDVKVQGYDVEAGTMVMVSVWAIGRDPGVWDEPENFMPERFLDSSIDFKGVDFELIPFGAGRRGCPAIAYSMATIELLLANLMHKFDWKLPDGIEGKDLDMNEGPGITAHRVVPLRAVATVAA